MTTKLMRDNGEVVHYLTYSDLTDANIQNISHIFMIMFFDRNIAER